MRALASFLLCVIGCLAMTTAAAEPVATETKPEPRAKTAEDKAAGRAKAQAKQARKDAAAALLQPTFADVKYGPYERNVLDFYQAKSATPTPLIVYIHGGGFVAGDKKTLNIFVLNAALQAGISVAAINYRFVDGKDVIFPVPQHDGARAVQFLRTKAKEWNLDPAKVACFGGSAGAGISMWIGFHDDLADPKNEDPVLRESTRIAAIATIGGQGTYDPIEIKKLVGGRAHEHPSIFKVYGNATLDELMNPTPERKKLFDEASAIKHLTKDDPPLYMVYNEPDVVPPADSKPGEFIHHPNFGKQLKARMDELGIENEYLHLSEAKSRNAVAEMVAFFQKQFGRTP
jgi:acetyl esterase